MSSMMKSLLYAPKEPTYLLRDMLSCRKLLEVPPSARRMIPSLGARRRTATLAVVTTPSEERIRGFQREVHRKHRKSMYWVHLRPFMALSDNHGGDDERKAHSVLRSRAFSAEPDTLSDASCNKLFHPVAVKLFLNNLERAAAWNHGQEGSRYDKSLWDPTFCRCSVDKYESYLQLLIDAANNEHNDGNNNNNNYDDAKQQILSAETVILALKALLKGHYEPPELSRRVREWERALGHLKQTPLTDALSFRLLTANGKSGNVGRVLSLLQLRKQRNYPPKKKEFEYAIRSLQASQWSQRRSRRNPFASDAQQAALDNPTRWLDAILINMHERGVPLTTGLANQMLACYAAGPTGKAVHHFYRVVRRPVMSLPPEERPEHIDGMPVEWVYVRDEEHDMNSVDEAMGVNRDESSLGNRVKTRATGTHAYLPIRAQLEYHRVAPPFYKIPAQVRGKLLPSAKSSSISPSASASPSSSPEPQRGQFKLERESETEYSYPLAAAFAFCDSLQHGACGHPGIELNVGSYNALIKACVHRGALWRAMHLIDETMPCQPNTMSFNLILAGLARVGDVHTAQDYYMKLLAAGLSPDAFTVRAIVDGLLNLGDIPGAVSTVQDFFNQHCILPPYTTHLKILEFCLGWDMVYEAKRYVWFLQQLWTWEPNAYHSEGFIKLMRATQRNEQLQRQALEQLFAYFGERLEDTDFL